MGLEPTTNGLEVRYSIQLSYTPSEQEGQTLMPWFFQMVSGLAGGDKGDNWDWTELGRELAEGGILPWGWGDKTGRLHWAHGCLQFSGFSEFPETRGLE